jgi:hypothetical protein
MAKLARVDVYTAYACKSGTRLGAYQAVLAADLDESLTGEDTIVVRCRQADEVVQHLVKRRILRVTLDDASFSEWRIQEIDQEHSSQGTVVVVKAVSPLLDLVDAGIISETRSSGVVEFDLGLVQVTVTEVIDNYILTNLPTEYDFFARGTVEPTATFDVNFSKATRLALLRQLANVARDATTFLPAEIRVRRNGTTNYLIDVLTEIGSSAAVVDLRTSKNIVRHRVTQDADELATVVLPFGADNATIARAAFMLDNGAANVFEITDPEGGQSPVLEDDQLNGMYVVPDGNGPLVQITDSAAGAPATVTLASSTGITDGNIYELRADSAGTLNTELTSPTRVAAPPSGFGRKVRTLDRPDLNGYHNLVVNPWFRNWAVAGNAPDNWEYVTGGGYFSLPFSQNTDPLYTQYGGYSVRVTSGGSATNTFTFLRSDVFYPRPVVGAEFFSYRLRVFPKVWSGACLLNVQLRKADDTDFWGSHSWIAINSPLGSGDAIPAGDWINLGLEGIDLTAATDGVRIAIAVQIGTEAGAFELYIDAVEVVQQPTVSEAWVEFSGANALWHAGNRALGNNRDGIDSYEISVLDRGRDDATTYPFEALVVGGTVRDTVTEQGIDAQLLRVLRKRTNLLVPKDTQLEVATRQKLLAELLAPSSGDGTVTASASGSGTPSSSLLKTIIADPPGVTTVLEDFPSALTDLGTECHFLVDLTNVARAYLSGVVIDDDGSAGELRCQYLRPSDTTWRYLDGAAGPELSMATIGDVQSAAAVTLENTARGIRWCRLVAIGGDDAADPEIGHVALLGGSAPTPVGTTPPSSNDWDVLIQTLGGDSEVPFFYDARFNVSDAGGGNADGIDDVRGATGYGPLLAFGDDVAWDPAVGSATFVGAQAWVSNVAFAGVDLSGPFTLIYVGDVRTGGAGREFVAGLGVPQNMAPTTVLGIRNNGGVIAGEALQGGNRYTIDSGVAVQAGVVRVAVVSQDGGTGLAFEVLSEGGGTDTLGGAMTPTSSVIALMEQVGLDFANRGDGQFRALIGVKHVLSAGELAAVIGWAEFYRGATRA